MISANHVRRVQKNTVYQTRSRRYANAVKQNPVKERFASEQLIPSPEAIAASLLPYIA